MEKFITVLLLPSFLFHGYFIMLSHLIVPIQNTTFSRIRPSPDLEICPTFINAGEVIKHVDQLHFHVPESQFFLHLPSYSPFILILLSEGFEAVVLF
jgi:hypothetical protein